MKELKSAPSQESIIGAQDKTHLEYSKDDVKRQLEELVRIFENVRRIDGILSVFFYGEDSISVHVSRELFDELYGNAVDEQIDLGNYVTIRTDHLQVTCEKGGSWTEQADSLSSIEK